MIKIATLEDKDLIVSLATQRVDELAQQLLETPNEQSIILLHEDKALMVAKVMKSSIGYLACDVLWYVKPEHRHNGIASKLLEAYEFWAKKVGCDYATMTTLNPSDEGDYFKNKGYELHDAMWIKSLKEELV